MGLNWSSAQAKWASFPRGYDAWVVGADAVELIDFGGNIAGGRRR